MAVFYYKKALKSSSHFLVKQFSPERFALFVVFMLVAAIVSLIAFFVAGFIVFWCAIMRFGPFDDFIKLPSIEPDPTTSGTIIDFDSVALANYQPLIDTYRAIHRFLL